MANVYMRRSSLAEFLKDLPTSFIVAVGPDHPLLLRASDLLIGGRGLMTALFLPTAAERRNPSLLKTRFVLNRLALPPHTRHILVAEPADLKLAGQLEHDFDAVLTWSDRGIVARLAQDAEFRSRHESLPPETVAAVRQQYGDALQITQIMQWLDERRRRGGTAPESVDAKPDPGDRRRRVEERSITTPYAYNVTVERFTNAKVNATEMLAKIHQQTERTYELDNGVPYRNLYVLPGMAIFQSLPVYQTDPDKLLRAAPFGGWALVNEDQAPEVPRLVRSLTERWDSRRRAARA